MTGHATMAPAQRFRFRRGGSFAQGEAPLARRRVYADDRLASRGESFVEVTRGTKGTLGMEWRPAGGLVSRLLA